MNLSTYSDDQYVKSFIEWIKPKLSDENSFTHKYESKKPKGNFKCNSIYSAYENYTWDGSSFNENQKKLFGFSERMNKGLENKDYESLKKTCLDILIWGGVDKKENIERINLYDKEIVDYLSNIKNDINLTSCDSVNLYYCNSGFSKIYSTIVDNFIIYDSRVSCALCYLIRSYAEENSKEKIPESLKFAYSVGNGKDRNKDRNPNKGKLKFRRLSQDNYLTNNIIASWLLKLIIDNTESKFNKLPENIRLRALESALFMIGYKIN